VLSWPYIGTELTDQRAPLQSGRSDLINQSARENTKQCIKCLCAITNLEACGFGTKLSKKKANRSHRSLLLGPAKTSGREETALAFFSLVVPADRTRRSTSRPIISDACVGLCMYFCLSVLLGN